MGDACWSAAVYSRRTVLGFVSRMDVRQTGHGREVSEEAVGSRSGQTTRSGVGAVVTGRQSHAEMWGLSGGQSVMAWQLPG